MTNAMPDEKVTIGLLWHSNNSCNLGVGALTAAHLDLLEAALEEMGFSATFEMTGWADPSPVYIDRPNVRFHPFDRAFLMGRDGLFSMARRCAFVLDIGGGDSFADIYGARRFWYQVLSKAVVIASGTPLILAPQTIGPFRSLWSRRVATAVMRRCALVVTRDAPSSRLVRNLDGRIPLLEATDVAFALNYVPVERPDDGKIRVGVNVSGLLFAGGYSRDNDFGLLMDYREAMRTIIRRVAERPGVDVHLFSHVVIPDAYSGVVEDDHHASMQLASEFGDNVHVVPKYLDPSIVKGHIASMDFFCGSRMHACIAAFSAGVPTVPIAYSRKFSGVFGTIGYDEVADPQHEDLETVVGKVLEGLDNRQMLARRMASGKGEIDRRLQAYRRAVQHELPARLPMRQAPAPVSCAAAL